MREYDIKIHLHWRTKSRNSEAPGNVAGEPSRGYQTHGVQGSGTATCYLHDLGNLTRGLHLLLYKVGVKIPPPHGFCAVGDTWKTLCIQQVFIKSWLLLRQQCVLTQTETL